MFEGFTLLYPGALNILQIVCDRYKRYHFLKDVKKHL